MKTVLILIFGFSLSALASEPNLNCVGSRLDLKTKDHQRVELKPLSYDNQFFEGKIGDMGFGVDTWDFDEDSAIGMVIIEEETRMAATAKVGFYTGIDSKTATHSLYVPRGDGYRVVYQINCFLR